MKVIIRESACGDLERIVHWIAQDNPENARSVATRILHAIEDKIALFPRMGRVGQVPGTREWVVRGLPYVIVYKLDEVRDAVVVLGIVHGAQRR